MTKDTCLAPGGTVAQQGQKLAPADPRMDPELGSLLLARSIHTSKRVTLSTVQKHACFQYDNDMNVQNFTLRSQRRENHANWIYR